MAQSLGHTKPTILCESHCWHKLPGQTDAAGPADTGLTSLLPGQMFKDSGCLLRAGQGPVLWDAQRLSSQSLFSEHFAAQSPVLALGLGSVTAEQ